METKYFASKLESQALGGTRPTFWDGKDFSFFFPNAKFYSTVTGLKGDIQFAKVRYPFLNLEGYTIYAVTEVEVVK